MIKNAVLYLASIVLLFTIVHRTFISGWGPPIGDSALSLVAYGITYGSDDNLVYCSFAQQSMRVRGLWRFSNLYTTVEHDRLLFNSLFLLVGRLSSFFSVSPVRVLNVLALLAIPLFMFCVARMCHILGLSKISGFAVVCLALGGGGISWIRLLIRLLIKKLGLEGVLVVGAPAPDLFYFDLYPATAFFIYPYQAITVAILSFLALTIVQYDDHNHRLSLGDACLIMGSALALASVRPYELVMVLTAYGSLVAASYAFQLDETVRRRRIVVLSCLLVGILPFLVYTFWFFQQPVWSYVSKPGWTLQYGDWDVAFFLLWILACVGIGTLGSRLFSSSFAFLALWSLGCGILLIVLNSGAVKLCGGCTIPLAVLGGLAVHKYEAQLRAKNLIIPALSLLVFLSLASPALEFFKSIRPRDRVRLPSELFQAIESIRSDALAPLPIVLTDSETGKVLPGLGGFRVFCGHQGLTDHYVHKSRLLARLGFGTEAEQRSDSGDSEILKSNAAKLLNQIKTGTFQYLLVRKDHQLYQYVAPDHAGSTIHDGPHFLAVRMSPDVSTVIAERLQTIASMRKGVQ